MGKYYSIHQGLSNSSVQNNARKIELDGNFLVSSLNDNLTEVVYGVPTSGAIAQVYPQDTMNGVGWQFISRSIGQIFIDGGAGIPRCFINRFGDIIPTSVKFALNSGEVLHGTYSKHSRKLYGFLPIIQKKYLQQFDIILFTYCGNGRFEVCIFDRSKVEKSFSMDLVLIESDSEESDSEDSDSEEETEGEGHDSELALEPYDQDLVDMTGQFAAAMLRSNIDHTTHGVYIPAYVTPNNRGWRCGEKVVLRTTTGEWTLGLVISNGGPRFSAGWNRFARENALKMNDILYFNLVEDDEVVVFEVEIQEDN